MKIYLVQHGEATAKEVDPNRALTEPGKADVQRIAAALKRVGVKATGVIHSGKLRAQQTAEILAAEIAPGLRLEINDLINPNDDPAALELLCDNTKTGTMLVGHLPFMAKLVSHLVTGDDSQPLVAYQPGSIVCLELTDNGNWQIDWMLRPEILI